MATKDEMIAVIDSMYKNNVDMLVKILREGPRMCSNIVKSVLLYTMRDAEDNGRCYNDFYKWKYCTCWRVGDYIITYLYDGDFNAEMLTEEMMDDLIIEEY